MKHSTTGLGLRIVSLLALAEVAALANACGVPIGAGQGQPVPQGNAASSSGSSSGGPATGGSGSGTDGVGSSGSGPFFDDAGVAFADASSVGIAPGPSFPSIAPRPAFGPTTAATVPPPPISGGTLLVTKNGAVIASDPDRDVVYVADTTSMTLLFTIALQPGDEPGRLAEDGAGRVHVALRSGGALVTVDPSTGTILARRAVCPAPRGVAWEAATDLVWVACATGELVALPSAGGAAAHSFVVERDLRDVVVQSGQLAVTKFRSAEVLRIAPSGAILRRDGLAAPTSMLPHVAWRTIAGPIAGTTITVHQAESTQSIDTHLPGGYAGMCPGCPPFGPPSKGIDLEAGVPVNLDGGSGALPIAPGPTKSFGPIVTSAVTVLDAAGRLLGSAPIPQGVLPVDVALSRDGTFVAVALAGNSFSPLMSVQVVSLDASSGASLPNLGFHANQVVAVAFDAAGNFLAQTREPAQLLIASATKAIQALPLSTQSRDDTGHDIFHAQAGGLMACASCHPEGGDDGHTWLLDNEQRRTPSLRGTIAGTAPYHWPGDEKDMSFLLDDVYTGRMSGSKLDSGQGAVLTSWVEAVPAPPAPSWVDRTAALRGQTLFESAATGCSTCHSGAKLTNNATIDVGTSHAVSLVGDGGPTTTAFQVPPLVGVGWRTPLFHDGCAATILDRFGKCATPMHGATSQLSKQDVADLTAYLETL
jgi:cytochrome c553